MKGISLTPTQDVSYPWVARMLDGTFRVIVKWETLGIFTTEKAALAFSRLVRW